MAQRRLVDQGALDVVALGEASVLVVATDEAVLLVPFPGMLRGLAIGSARARGTHAT